jgi:ribonuclease Z
MTAGQAAAIARDAEVDELVLLHFSKRYQEAGYESILADARKIFPETTIPMQWSD